MRCRCCGRPVREVNVVLADYICPPCEAWALDMILLHGELEVTW